MTTFIYSFPPIENFAIYYISQQVVLIMSFNLLVGSQPMKAEWRSASMECGGQCVMIALEVPKLCADSWDYLTQVSYCGFRIIDSSVYIANSITALWSCIWNHISVHTGAVALPWCLLRQWQWTLYHLDDVCCTGRESSLLSCNTQLLWARPKSCWSEVW